MITQKNTNCRENYSKINRLNDVENVFFSFLLYFLLPPFLLLLHCLLSPPISYPVQNPSSSCVSLLPVTWRWQKTGDDIMWKICNSWLKIRQSTWQILVVVTRWRRVLKPSDFEVTFDERNAMQVIFNLIKSGGRWSRMTFEKTADFMEDFYCVENWPSKQFVSFSSHKKRNALPNSCSGTEFSPANRTGPWHHTWKIQEYTHSKKVSGNVANLFLQCIREK